MQHSFKKFEIRVVIDEKLRNKDPSIEKIFLIIENGFHEKVGLDVEIVIKEVTKIDKKLPRIVTKVDKNKFKIKRYV